MSSKMSDVELLTSITPSLPSAPSSWFVLLRVHYTHLVLVQCWCTRHYTPNVVVGMALFCGGLAQLLAGQWEYATGNTFGATGNILLLRRLLAFLRGLLIPGSGIGEAYAASPDPAKEVDAIAIYLTTWAVVTFLFFIATLRKSIALACSSSPYLTFALLAIWQREHWQGWWCSGVITALIAYYIGLAEMLTEDDLFMLPLGKHDSKMA
ncbi:GPR1/FUN34/yaaH family-domain-containing protein [Lactarius quietus]|nr:GPR1/FUN34/yaaH family-domain-containing protein [Lactarius quietus]